MYPAACASFELLQACRFYALKLFLVRGVKTVLYLSDEADGEEDDEDEEDEAEKKGRKKVELRDFEFDNRDEPKCHKNQSLDTMFLAEEVEGCKVTTGLKRL